MNLRELKKRLDRRCEITKEPNGRHILWVNREYHCSGGLDFIESYCRQNLLIIE